jgi:NADH:ubiquinone oxidoreductase subunit C
MDKLSNEMVWELLRERFGDQVQIAGEPHGLLTVVTTKEEIIQLLTFAKEDERLQFSYLTDITAVHYPEQRNAFAIVYHLHDYGLRYLSMAKTLSSQQRLRYGMGLTGWSARLMIFSVSNSRDTLI